MDLTLLCSRPRSLGVQEDRLSMTLRIAGVSEAEVVFAPARLLRDVERWREGKTVFNTTAGRFETPRAIYERSGHVRATLVASDIAALEPLVQRLEASGYQALQSRIRVLRAENNRLTSTMNENRIHYQLLRNHGYDEHSPECLELVRRQNSLGHQLDQVSVAISAWLAMESQLLESIRKHGPTREVPCTDRELRQHIEQHLARSGLNTAAPPPIPDELWLGGGDIRMGLPDNTRSTDRSADKTSPGHDHECHRPVL
jgi:hypothetical protein